MQPLRSALPILIALSLLLPACGSGTEGSSTSTPLPNPTTAHPEQGSGVLEQTPAAEVLGSTVQRNLRYQPNEEVAQYLHPDTLLEFIRQVDLSLRHQIGKLDPEQPGAGTVVVGLNSRQETRLWYVFPEGKPSAAFKAAAQRAVAAVPKPPVRQRLVVFGVALTLWGYQETEEEAQRVELPREWRAISDRLKGPQPATKLAEMAWDEPVQ